MNTYSKPKIFLISLGCSKNLVDSEHLLGLLKSKGYEFAAGIDEAEIAVINTCGFIQPAVEETIDTIVEIGNLKKEGKLKRLFVAGCFVQRYGYKLRKGFPEVDGWLGTGEVCRITDIIEGEIPGLSVQFHMGRPLFLADHQVPRVQTTPFYSGYLKIAEGCSHECTYCIIPALRGPFRSQKMESLLIEAKKMADRGVKEINLIAQDTTMYGKDLSEDIGIEELLEKLAVVEGIRWLRLLYCHPGLVSDRLLELLESVEVICPYLDIPFQHVNEKILRAMGRNHPEKNPWDLLERVRSLKRKIGLRTTIMVGFPGETEEMFEELCAFVKRARFDHLGAFIFSPEKGTSAARLKPLLDRKAAEQRLDKLMTIQKNISATLNKRMVGQILPVLVEGISPETELLLTGRTSMMAPEVDGRVLINKGDGVAGEIMPVLIREAHAYDLVGEIVN